MSWNYIRIIAVAATLFVGCGDDGDNNSTKDTPDMAADIGDDASHTSLEFVSQAPADGAASVAVNQELRFVFSAALDPRTVTSDTLRIFTNDVETAGKLVVDGKVIRFIPALFLPDTTYQGELMDIGSSDGALLEGKVEFSFTTGNTLLDGTPAPPSLNNDTLPTRFTRLSRKVEILAIGDDFYGDNKNVFIFDPQYEDFSETLPTPDLLTSELHLNFENNSTKFAVAASIDEDFREEAIVLNQLAGGVGALSVIRVVGETDTTMDISPIPRSLEVPNQGTATHTYDLAVGDIDGDGFDEILVAGIAGGAAHVWVYDDAVHQFELIKEFVVEGFGGVRTLSIAAGNLEGNATEELIIAYQAETAPNIQIQVFPDLDAEPYEATISLPGPDTAMLVLRTGNLDGVSGDELAVGIKTGANTYTTDLVGFSVVDGVLTERARVTKTTTCTNSTLAACDQFPFELMDYDGDETKEIYMKGQLYSGLTETNPFAEVRAFTAEDTPNQQLMGDIDGDGRDDMFVSGRLHDQGVSDFLTFWSYQEIRHFDPETGEQLPSDFEWQDATSSLGAMGEEYHLNTVFVLLDLDRDSTVLEQSLTSEGHVIVNESVEQIFRDNIILAAVAAPPCAEEIGQDLGACSTGFGVQTGATLTAGTEFGVSLQAKVGYEVDVQVGGGLIGALTTTVSKSQGALFGGFETSVYASLSASASQTTTDYAGATEDLVIFSTTPHNRYTYEIVSIDIDGAEEIVGEKSSWKYRSDQGLWR